MSTSLESLIILIRDNVSAGRYTNEQTVREAIVAPLLRQLGWDDLDPLIVIREYSLSGRRVDYALAPTGELPAAIIEVKAIGQIEGADRQLFEYAFIEGVPFAILTDGQQWHFFLPGEQGDYTERRVYKLDLVEREPQHASEILERYLSFPRFQSGEALNDARKDYQNAARKRQAAKMLPKAWSEIVSERDELLLDLIAERAENLCGIRPDAEQVEAFVAENLENPASSRPPPGPTGGNTSGPSLPTPPPSPPKAERSREVNYELEGHVYKARNAKEALLEILKQLSRTDPQFIEKLAPRVKGRNRNHIAAHKHEVYPNRPDLAENASEISPGWWIGLNIANREKRRILEAACEVAGIRFGHDLKIDLPNS